MDEYIIANCEYPGAWKGAIERIELCDQVIVSIAHLWLSNHAQSFHATSFYRFVEDRIIAMDEYWGDDGEAPSWRKQKHIGKTIQD